MIRITDLHFSLDYCMQDVRKRVCKILHVQSTDIQTMSLFRISIDARKKTDVHFILSVDVYLKSDEKGILAKSKYGKAKIEKPYSYPLVSYGKKYGKPLIVGAGPAGLFAALVLAQAGAEPILIERGKCIEERTKDVEVFWKTGLLNTASNVQFGEGGAGTFSDGKLNTGTKDIRARKVLTEFAAHGAPGEILYQAKPHIGTDKLKTTIANIRKTILSLGGTVLFETRLTGLDIKDNKLRGAVVLRNGSKETIETDSLILAIGHSARDTFESLYKQQIPMEAKAFSVGARIEHLRENIDRSQYGDFCGSKALGAAPYKLNVHLKNGRGVYTFCMCPGGKVVAAASEEGGVVTNGMSDFARNEINSNSALLVGVTPEDFSSSHPLAGVQFQRELEARAFLFGGKNYNAPVQRVEDFLHRRTSAAYGEVLPSYKPGCQFAQMDSILPDYICDSMRQAIVMMDQKLRGFANGDALLTGAETRSSSPVRILRNQQLESIAVQGLYPCGEGAGYAGGIVSAAVDGIKCAEKIIERSNSI